MDHGGKLGAQRHTALFSQQPAVAPFKDSWHQRTSIACATIKVHAVAMVLRGVERGVSMHQQFAEVVIAFQKAIPDPQKVFDVLFMQLHAGAQTRMDKQHVLGLMPKR